MKTIYTSNNVKKTLLQIQRRYNNLYNKNYSVQQVIYAFNKLPGKYQDLLLKINKDENDKIKLIYAYDMIKKNLLLAKNVPSDIKISLKNINNVKEVIKEEVSMEDIEADKGDKWVKPVEKKQVKVIETNFPKKIVFEKKKEKTLVFPKLEEEKKENKIIEEIEELKKIEKKEILLKEYIEERKFINIEEILDNIEMDDDDKFILLIKYDNNSVKTNEEVSKEVNLKTSYIDEVVDRFFNLSIELKKKKIYTLERK